MSVTRIALFIQTIQVLLYILGALALLISMRSFIISRHDLRIAEFELERELARRKEANAVTRTLAFVEVLLAIFAIANVVAPSLQLEPLNPDNPALGGIAPQPTFAPFYTSTPGGNGIEASGTPGAAGADVIANLLASASAQPIGSNNQNQILSTPTLAPTLVGTINPDAPKALGCDTPGATLEIPANGQTIYDSLTIRGTANVQNFSRYKFELSGPSTGNAFTPFGGDKTSPVPSLGTLGQLNLNAFQPGSYQFRLAVFDTTDTLKASCTVNVELRARPATATPLPPTPTAENP